MRPLRTGPHKAGREHHVMIVKQAFKRWVLEKLTVEGFNNRYRNTQSTMALFAK